ncbi:Complement C3 [Liparis tanakae]|uniref:Complement C3 n=1 Tax=Liparis tanakae TaxID=230148 RepID=A0A4Z2EG10_9TELE|nr:Complement C3 [Liparis tanakae]
MNSSVTIDIKNADGMVVKRISRIRPAGGVFADTLHLPESVNDGKWTVTAKFDHRQKNTFTSQFQVKQYVPLAFNVILTPRKSFLNLEDSQLEVEVSASSVPPDSVPCLLTQFCASSLSSVPPHSVPCLLASLRASSLRSVPPRFAPRLLTQFRASSLRSVPPRFAPRLLAPFRASSLRSAPPRSITYLDGQPVQGTAYVVFGVKINQEMRKFPSLKQVSNLDGGVVSLSMEEIKRTYPNVWSLVGKSLYVKASVLTQSGKPFV